ncbi:hypothetical protein [Calorimonas adulescens]|jgi:hypothetical protein|uniref:DUF3794 domain-containing protein n=1 Tax=Calorimonas adulescens TaxID=2606906 RepID=A0A5D8QEJ5_9THEO|nr:hypothetical protein [Calorimonas adulescens]TZE82266.1 hypothetical protein FWJ32_05805 [Calorimonas adulescens]
MAFSKKQVGQFQIVPGPVEPGQVPDPTEIACIITDKVYDACSQRVCIDTIPAIPFIPTISTPIEFGGCRDFVITVPAGFSVTPIPDRDGFSRVMGTFQVSFNVVLSNTVTNTTQLIPVTTTFDKDVVLYVPQPSPANIRFEAMAECLFGRVNPINTIDVIIGVFVIIKSAITVQLLIPAYGFCPTPPECEEFPTNVCEQFMTAPFPEFFPPQIFEICPPYGPYSPYCL